MATKKTKETKQSKENVNQKQPELLNPNDYVYENGQKVEIDGNFMLDMLKAFHLKLQDEIEIKFEIVPDDNKDKNGNHLPPKKERRVYLSEFGNFIEGVINYFTAVHNENVHKGVAKKKGTPTFDLTSVNKK